MTRRPAIHLPDKHIRIQKVRLAQKSDERKDQTYPHDLQQRIKDKGQKQQKELGIVFRPENMHKPFY